MATFETYITFPESDNEELSELEIDVRIDYDAYYQPAYVSGPPEDCYPAEGDMELNSIDPVEDLPKGITQEMFKGVVDASLDRLTDEAWDHYHVQGEP